MNDHHKTSAIAVSKIPDAMKKYAHFDPTRKLQGSKGLHARNHAMMKTEIR